jgi:membrane peptidoglycan carboxypeptidase
MGVTGLRDRNLYGPSLTIGGGELHLLDLAYAYSVFANNGVMSGMPSVGDLETGEEFPEGYRELDPVAVLKVEDSDGKVLYEFTQPEQRQVVPAAGAYIITDILSKEAITWSGLTIGRPAAVKTGTSESFRDNTIAGYTPDIAVAIWVGNSDGTFMRAESFASGMVGPIWKAFMAAALEGVSASNFERPDGVTDRACAGGRCSSGLAIDGLSTYNLGQASAAGTRSGGNAPSPTASPQSNSNRGQQNSNSNSNRSNNSDSGNQSNNNQGSSSNGDDDDDD